MHSAVGVPFYRKTSPFRHRLPSQTFIDNLIFIHICKKKPSYIRMKTSQYTFRGSNPGHPD